MSSTYKYLWNEKWQCHQSRDYQKPKLFVHVDTTEKELMISEQTIYYHVKYEF